ncbi:hypothetical protein CYMTET_24172 [Cymbomonas tetramitiformis]|uniref:Uncharacterized protein n=1 Tax=Cymbomonas tetramitiformis TaxID=36881 RepID=A0AAE0L0J2_9CHLO|nr:hypothetical protein CYMTET_24172 [Cymbomonas tetramitiformis]
MNTAFVSDKLAVPSASGAPSSHRKPATATPRLISSKTSFLRSAVLSRASRGTTISRVQRFAVVAEDGLGAWFKKAQGAVPIVGLISRLTTVEGGVGEDVLNYQEYCR